jgi:hypothetical protein
VGLTIPTFSSLKTFGPALAGLFFIPGGMYWHWAPISLLASVHHFRWQQCFQGGADPTTTQEAFPPVSDRCGGHQGDRDHPAHSQSGRLRDGIGHPLDRMPSIAKAKITAAVELASLPRTPRRLLRWYATIV